MDNCFEVDLADVSSLDYYTGLSFKVFVRGVGYRVGRGGRYDKLAANFGESEPAVGFVLSLDSLIEVLGRDASTNGGNEKANHSISTNNLAEAFSEAQKRRARNEQVRIELKKQ
jgi:ATP phosphoribosyltransferase regulatory subunit